MLVRIVVCSVAGTFGGINFTVCPSLVISRPQ